MTGFPPPPDDLVKVYSDSGYWTDEVLGDVLMRWSAERPHDPALLIGGERITYLELADRARSCAAALANLAITKGDVVAVQLPNTPEYVVAYLAICLNGAVMQTIHMPYRASELEFLLGHARAKAFVCLSKSGEFSPAGTALSLSLPALEHVIALGEPISGTVDFGDLTEGATPAPPLPRSGSDPFLLLYTSGTTADPKGVPHCYRNFLCNSRLSAHELEIASGDVLLSLAPMTHLYGLFVFHIALMSGAAVSLLPAFAPPDFAKTIADHRVTKIFAAPAHLAATLKSGLLDTHDFSSVRFICLSGSTVPPALAQQVEEKLPHGRTIQLWGMSELQAGTFSRPGDARSVRHHTAGSASPGTELRVVDESGNELPAGTEGRLRVRGPSIFAGYLHNDAATAAAFNDEGWFETGDTAKLSGSGSLTITGRVKEIINRGGIKFSPVDIELIIDAMPQVERSAIIPYPDEVLGERACVCVVPAAGAEVSLADILATLEAAAVAKFKWPERLQVIDAMPLTPTQKIMRGRLADRLEGVAVS